MDKNMKFVEHKKIERTIKALKNNNMEAEYFESIENMQKYIKELLFVDAKVSVGGSMTLFESGVIQLLKGEAIQYLDRYEEGLSKEDIKNIYAQTFSADFYFTSSNAVTESGFLYNVDGRGNRVAAITYGPERVIVIIGSNKIVKSTEEAIKRNEEIAAPANAKRLQRKTPCAIDGKCRECSSEDRICCSYVLTKRQLEKGRIHVLILSENFGY